MFDPIVSPRVFVTIVMITISWNFRLQDPREEVIQAWFMDDSDEDQRLPHHLEPKQYVSLQKLDGTTCWEMWIE